MGSSPQMIDGNLLDWARSLRWTIENWTITVTENVPLYIDCRADIAHSLRFVSSGLVPLAARSASYMKIANVLAANGSVIVCILEQSMYVARG